MADFKTDEETISALFKAVTTGSKAAAPSFLREKLNDDPDLIHALSSGMGKTLLMNVSWVNRANLVEILLQYDADPTHENREGTAISHAALMGHSESLEVMLDAQPELLNWQDSDGFTMLSHAINGGRVKTIEMLLARGANVNVGPPESPNLHLASEQRKPKILNLIITHGADLNIRNTNGLTALENIRKLQKSETWDVQIKQYERAARTLEKAIAASKSSSPAPKI